MTALFAYIEEKEARTEAAKALVMPLLQFLDDEVPWTSPNLRGLYQARADYDPVIGQALEHLYRYALPLLEAEERLSELPLEGFGEALARFEGEFWRARFAEEGSSPQPGRVLCARHGLLEADVLVLARQGVYDSEQLALALGVPPACPDCRTGIARAVLADLKEARLAGRTA